MISVVIATCDRAEALEKYALSSLLKQGMNSEPFKDYEIIVWDASSGNHAQVVADQFIECFKARGVSLRYFRAPRRGSCSQRNDALAQARGDIVAFFDDDSEISDDGLFILSSLFSAQPLLLGAGLRLLDRHGNLESPTWWQRNLGRLPLLKRFCFRRVKWSGGSTRPSEVPGPAEWLTGCSMAFRRSALEKIRFDERLERFGPYAMGEDRLISHQIMKLGRRPLVIAAKGYVWHHTAPGGRVTGASQIAMTLYNRYIIWRTLTDHPILTGPFFAISFSMKTLAQIGRGGWRVWLEGIRLILRIMNDRH